MQPVKRAVGGGMIENDRTKYSGLGRWGQVVSLFLSVSSLSALVVALVMAPPRSGPFCRGNDCITFPYTDAAAHVPNDYVWMYFAVVMSLAFLAWVVCVVSESSPSVTGTGVFAVVLATVATTVLLFAYGVQLLVMQPSLVKGETEGLSPWSQYNPQGIFIALECLGYWLAALALIGVASMFQGTSRIDRWRRWIALLAGSVTVALLPIMGLIYRSDLEYRYEVIAIAILWPAFTVLGVLCTRASRRLSRIEMS